MKRSTQVTAPLLAAAALSLLNGCRKPEMQRCVDEQNHAATTNLSANPPAPQAIPPQRPDGHTGSAATPFTAAEISPLEAAGNERQEMCLAAAQHIIDEKRYAELDIPDFAIEAIEWAWNSEPPALYGRFDLSWAGAQSGSAPKLLEYNADTPTSLLEAAVVQWHWLKDIPQNLLSYN